MARGQFILSTEDAEILAYKALTWLVADDEQVQSFALASGALPADFAGLIQSRPFLVALLEFLTADDTRVLSFADSTGFDPMAPLEALRMLQGRSGMNWT